MANVDVRVLADAAALHEAAAAYVAEVLEGVLAGQDRAAVALAGGSTPRGLYRRLAHAGRLPWDLLYLFWGDERFVPLDHPASNYAMAHEALLRHVPLPPGHLFPVPTQAASPQAAAAAYEATLRQFFATPAPAFDVVLLGLGEDGHTASLFPEDAPHRALSGEGPVRWVEAVEAPPRYEIRPRVTLTLPALNAARHVVFLVSGAGKRAALHGVLDAADPTLPAAHVRARERLVWFVDQEAFGE